MKERIKIKVFWKITEKLNKNLCDNKIKIKKIVFFDKTKGRNLPKEVITGTYDIANQIIGIKSKRSLLQQIDTLCHELSHAYQHQILKYPYGRKKIHDKKGGAIYQKFLKETDKILRVGFK